MNGNRTQPIGQSSRNLPLSLFFFNHFRKTKLPFKCVGWKEGSRSIFVFFFFQRSLVWSLNPKEWKWHGCDRYCGNQLSPLPTSRRLALPKLYTHLPVVICLLTEYWLTQLGPSQTARYPKNAQKSTSHSWRAKSMENICALIIKREKKGEGGHLQQLVTAKLFATSRLSMWGVSLNSEVPNWTIPIRNALYSWSAPLGKSPPAKTHQMITTLP